MYIAIVSPCVAGLVALIKLPSPCVAAALLIPFAGKLKIPGEVAAIGTTTEFDFALPTVTKIVAVDPVTSNGTIALICVDDTEYTGAAVPFTDT
jgi:hypothetical protein